MIPGTKTRFFAGVFLPLVFCVSVVKGAGSQPAQQDPPVKAPHIVVLLVDDMGYGDVGAYNELSKIPTPNIDRLAREGMRFTDAHAPGAVCHPSRYGLITGRYPFRTNVRVWPDSPVIEEGRMTIASLLRSNGYRTAMVGKWHLGFDESESVGSGAEETGRKGLSKAAFRRYRPHQHLPGGPVDRGFDSFFGIRASTDIPPYFYIRNNQVVAPPVDTILENNSEGWTTIQGAFWREGGIAPDLKLNEVLPRFTEEAVGIIENHPVRHGQHPLFLYLALPAPHTPWLPADEFRGISGAGEYGDFVAMVDANIGEIYAALERAGMLENTLFVFTSDNGPVWYREDIHRFGHDSNFGIQYRQGRFSAPASFRGMKADAYEGGHHMPFIVRWPRVVEAGSLTGQTISFVDLMATFAAIIDVELPANAGEDSFSFLPVLTGNQAEGIPIRPPVVSVSGRGLKSIQQGQWKLIEKLGSGGFTSPATLEPTPAGPTGQLYDLIEDPSETNNLWNDFPDRVQQLIRLMREWERAGTSR